MKISTFIRFAVLLFLFAESTSALQAQGWQYGQYINEQVASPGMSFYALGGCMPTPDVQWSLTIPEVSGVSFFLICTSADPVSSFINPGNDTLAIGDTIELVPGGNPFSLFYFSENAATMPVLFDLYAEGTPTQDGQPYPCNITELLWMSNLGICPDQQSLTLPTDCIVGTGISVTENEDLALQFISPSEANDFMLRFKNVTSLDRIEIYNMAGVLVFGTSNVLHNVIDCSSFASGVYLVSARTEEGQVLSNRMSIVK